VILKLLDDTQVSLMYYRWLGLCLGEVGEYLVATIGASNIPSAYMMLWIKGNFGTQLRKD
jgi:hypothetical protein